MKLNEIFSSNVNVNKQYGVDGHTVYYNFYVNDIEYQFAFIYRQQRSTNDVNIFELEFYPTSTEGPKHLGIADRDELPRQDSMLEVLNACLSGFSDFYEQEMEGEKYHAFVIETHDSKLERIYKSMVRKIKNQYPDLNLIEQGSSIFITDIPQDQL